MRFTPVKEQKVQGAESPLRNIAQKQDSIACSWRKLEEKYNSIEAQETFDVFVELDSYSQQYPFYEA